MILIFIISSFVRLRSFDVLILVVLFLVIKVFIALITYDDTLEKEKPTNNPRVPPIDPIIAIVSRIRYSSNTMVVLGNEKE